MKNLSYYLPTSGNLLETISFKKAQTVLGVNACGARFLQEIVSSKLPDYEIIN